MWVTYIVNKELKSSAFQYIRSFLEPKKTGNNVSYDVESVFFEGVESLPYKVYNLENKELICYTSPKFEDLKKINDSCGLEISEIKATVSLKFFPDEKEKYDEFYSTIGYPICDSSSFQACCNLVNACSLSGMSILNFKPFNDNIFIFQISSDSVLEIISDVEVFKFISSTMFRDINGKFLVTRSSKDSFFELEFSLKKNLKDSFVDKLKDFPLEIDVEEKKITIKSQEPSPNTKMLVSDVLSILSS